MADERKEIEWSGRLCRYCIVGMMKKGLAYGEFRAGSFGAPTYSRLDKREARKSRV